MPYRDEDKLARLQAVLTALLRHQLSESLARVEGSLLEWRGGELGPFEAHAEVLKHAARAERLASRIAQAGPDAADSVLRDAYDLDLVPLEEFVALSGRQPEEVEPSPPLEEDVPGLPDKQEFVEELLQQGPVLVHVNAGGEDVQVPDRFVGDPKLVLRFGYGLSPAIVDLVVDAAGIAGTLTFGGVPFHCVLPWTALYAVVAESDQRGMVWPDDVPPAVLEHMSRRDEPAPAAVKSGGVGTKGGARPSKPRRASHLKLVE